MAREERKKEDLFIKEKRRSKNFFITSSVKMNDNKNTKTTISSSVFTEMSKSFSDGEHLLDDHMLSSQRPILYMLQEMQSDLNDVYNEVSASSFQSSFFPFTRINTGSFGVISSSLVPDGDDKYDLGAVGKEWNDIFIDGTANIDSLAMGTTITTIKDEDNMSSNSATSLATQQSIKAYVDANAGSGGGGSGNYDTGSHLVPHADNTYDLGSSAKEWKNLYVDGIAYLDIIANTTINGATMDSNLTFKRAVIAPSAIQVTSIPQNGLIDMRQYSVVEIKQKIGNWSITTARPAAAFQEITIIGLTAGVIRHNSKGTAFTFSFANGSNLAVSAGQVYKFIVDGNNIWRQIH